MTNFKLGDMIVKNEKETRVSKDCYTKGFNSFLEGEAGKITKISSPVDGYAWAQNAHGGFCVSLAKIKLKEEPKMSNTFTKDMLKSGMRVRTEGGGVYAVIKNGDELTFSGLDRWNEGESYNEDLTIRSNAKSLDIVEVLQPQRHSFMDLKSVCTSIWKREEPKPETLELNGKTYLKSDIEEALAKLSPIENKE